MQNPSFSIYDASAGSGKTYTLVKEYLKIILSAKKPDGYRNILAITFTNKAVNEMKSRVITNLSGFASENPSEKVFEIMQDISIETGLSLHDIQQKAKSIIKNLIHNYAAFDISTIDKFTHKVIRAFAYDLNLPVTFEVSLDTENLLNETVDSIIAEAGNDEELTKLLVDFTMEKTDDDKSWDISREIFETAKLILNENNREEITHFNDTKIEDFLILKTKLQETCNKIENETINLAQEALELIENKSIDLKSFSGGYFPKHLLSITEKKFNPNHKTYHQFEDIKINKTAVDRDKIESIIPDLLEKMAMIYKKFEKKNFYEAFLKNITPLSLLNVLGNKLEKIQEEQNILSITEFNKLIHNEIQNQPAPFIYERLGEKYRHFFIDEFQDTSEMQWHNLIPLISNSLSGMDDEGKQGTLMIVGDPKQSIYRWRGGKAEQFIELNKNNNPFVNVKKQTIHLDTNYRSFSEIIDFNNAFFKFISGEFLNEDYRNLYLKNSFQKQNSKKGGYVSLTFLPKKDEILEEENDKIDLYLHTILNKINQVKEQGFTNQDIAILTRKKEPGTAIANFLTQNEIPVISSESLMINASSEVQFVIHFLHYLKNINNLEAKAHILYYLAKKLGNSKTIHDFIADGILQKNETEFSNWLFERSIEIDFKTIRKKSLYEAVEIIISKCIDAEKKNAYIQFFLDIVLERDIKNQSGLSDFLDYWEKNNSKLSIPSPENTDAIKIMTIHKSKGLEFPVVIFPFAEEDYNKRPREKMWLNADEKEMGFQKVLVDKNNAIKDFGEDAASVYLQKNQEDILDNINILYVALTRAEEQLHIISQMQNTNKTTAEYPNNMASLFIKFLIHKNKFEENTLQYDFGNSIKISKSNPSIESSKPISQLQSFLNPKNIKIAQRESLMWNTKQQKAIEYGNILHEILSFIETKDDITLAITKAIENGWVTIAQKEEVEKTLLEIITHDEVKLFFDGEHKILNEKTIIQKEGNLVKPDRIVINKDNEVFLLDYKTGQFLPKHKAQLENYQSAIEKMNLKVVKKTLVYIGETLEVVNL